MAARGGKRPGAGRKAKAVKYSGAINRAEKQIVDRLPKLIDNLFKLADGFLAQKADSDGGVDIYSTIPDRVANQYLIDRILGRPTERQDVTSDGKPLASAVHIYLPDNGRDDADPPEQPASTGVPGQPG